MNRKPQQQQQQQQPQPVQQPQPTNTPAHRVNGSMLGQYKNKRVTLVGRTNEEGAFVTSDSMVVKINSAQFPQEVRTYEVLGIVQPDLSVTAKEIIEYSPYQNQSTGKAEDFDLATYDELVKLAAGPFRELFYA